MVLGGNWLLLFGGLGCLFKRAFLRGSGAAWFSHLFFTACSDAFALGVDVRV